MPLILVGLVLCDHVCANVQCFAKMDIDSIDNHKTFDIIKKILNFYYNPYIKNMTIDDLLHSFFGNDRTGEKF